MPLYRADVTITVTGPLLTKSSAPGAWGVDSVCARNAAGELILPWTMIKGRIRDAWRELRHVGGPDLVPDPIEILGPENEGAAGNRSHPDGSFTRHNTSLFGTDFVLKREHEDRLHELTRTRISQDPDRHAASEDMLQVMESLFQAGEKYDFEGVIEYDAPDRRAADDVKRMVVKSLRWAGVLGSQTSVGFGGISKIDWHARDPQPVAFGDTAPKATNMWLRLTADQPLCITEERSKENLFVGGVVIPGAVIKGSVAAQWRRELGLAGAEVAPGDDLARPELAAGFEKIRFSHARPVAKGATARPVVIPLSLAKVGSAYRDMAQLRTPPDDMAVPPEFQPDWKDWTKVNTDFGWPKVRKELRVRTAIDATARRAKTGNLFAYETVVPDGLEWYCEVSFQALTCATAAQARAQLLDLLRFGLRGVGKTKATLRAELAEPPAPKVASLSGAQNGAYILSLQTPALLVPPTALRGSRDPEHLLNAYRSVFDDLSHHALRLENLFASQFLQGGLYLHRRFQDEHHYQPYALTAAGSVFVFRIVDGQEQRASEFVNQWWESGLPVPAWAVREFARNGGDGAHWKNNPFVPENGFGEVAVNLETHFQGGNHA
jgi:hypothetical protein